MKSYVAKKPTESSKRTRHTIGRTFLDIASEVPFNKVSVREICNRMGITRTAFYYHYDDVYSVLDDILKNMAEECCIDDLFISSAEKRIGGLDMPNAHFLLQNGLEALHELVRASSLPHFVTDLTLRLYRRNPQRVYVPISDDAAMEHFFCYCRRCDEKRYLAWFQALERRLL